MAVGRHGRFGREEARFMRRTKRPRRSTRLEVLTLEDRIVPAILTVTGTGDAIAVDGVVTLREAITSANTNANVNADVVGDGDYGTDTIRFNIPAADPGHFYYRTDGTARQVTRANVAPTVEADDGDIADIDPDHPHSWFSISPASALPTISGPLTIDGYTQSGASPNTNSVESMLGLNAVVRIELEGSSAGSAVNGLTVSAGDSAFRGLAINRFMARSGVALTNSNNIVIEGNLIGTDTSGTVAMGNRDGVTMEFQVSDIRVGGTAPAARNLISGNSSTGVAFGAPAISNLVQGNLIGTDLAGARGLGNAHGVLINAVNSGAVGTVIGGAVAGARNVISGNRFEGVSVGSLNNVTSGTVIQGNYIGTDVTGTVAVGNAGAGIAVGTGAQDTIIGGTTALARNVVSGNQGAGISVGGNPPSVRTSIVGNFIGTQSDGLAPLGNSRDGVFSSSSATTIGGTDPDAGNVISFSGESGISCFVGTADIRGNAIFSNNQHGVFINSATSPVLGNTIHDNGGLGIELGVGSHAGVTPNDSGDADGGPFIPNNLQNFPELLETLSTAGDSTIFAFLDSLPQTEFLIQFFANDAADTSGHGEGQSLLGETIVRTDNDGDVSFTFDVPETLSPEQQVTATATRLSDHDNNPNTPSIPVETSEFSQAISGAASILELGQTIEREILLGQEVSFRLLVPPGTDAVLSAHFDDPRIGELLVRVADLPDVNSFGQRVVAFVNPDPEFLLPGSPAPYFIRIRGTSTAGVAAGQFSLTAQAVEPEIDRIAPNLGSNGGQVTTTIVGSGFSAETAIGNRHRLRVAVAGRAKEPAPVVVIVKDVRAVRRRHGLQGVLVALTHGRLVGVFPDAVGAGDPNQVFAGGIVLVRCRPSSLN
jgi:hypothetical protein